MSNERKRKQRWNVKDFAVVGVWLGFAVGFIHAYVHAFWSQSHGHNEIDHILWRMVIFVVAGAALSAAIAVIHSWLMRKP